MVMNLFELTLIRLTRKR